MFFRKKKFLLVVLGLLALGNVIAESSLEGELLERANSRQVVSELYGVDPSPDPQPIPPNACTVERNQGLLDCFDTHVACQNNNPATIRCEDGTKVNGTQQCRNLVDRCLDGVFIRWNQCLDNGGPV